MPGPTVGIGKCSRKQERERSFSNGAYITAGETEEKPEKYQLVPNVTEKISRAMEHSVQGAQ